MFEEDLTSEKERNSYWDDMAPIWQVMATLTRYCRQSKQNTTELGDNYDSTSIARLCFTFGSIDRLVGVVGVHISSHPFPVRSLALPMPPTHFLLVQRFDQLPEVVTEQDVCKFVIGVDDHMAQPVLDDRVAAPVVPTRQEQPSTAADRSLTRGTGLHTLEEQRGESFGAPSTGSAPPFGTAARPSTRMPEGTMEEMLRVRDYFAR